MIYIIPLLVFHVVDFLVKRTFGEEILLVAAMAAVQLLASMFVTFPATVAVSEICLGIKPSVGRSYKRGFAQPGKVLGTYLLAFAIIILGLLALLTGFTFSIAIGRFETRRELVLEHANAVGTAYLRVQLLPEPHLARMSGLIV